jgi:hypothetical protein
LTARMVFHICETRVCILERILLFFVREGLIGSRAYIKALSTGDGLGLLSTHDLELTDFENEIPALTNAHLQDTVSAGALLFDYTLRPDPCPPDKRVADYLAGRFAGAKTAERDVSRTDQRRTTICVIG